jgi:transposase
MKRAARRSQSVPAEGDKQRKSFTIEALWAEVQELRKALEASEKRAAALELRVKELEAENDKLRKAHWKTEEFLQKKIRRLEKKVKDRDSKIAKLKKDNAWLRKQQFGQTSEKSRPKPTAAKSTDISNPPKGTGRKKGQQPGSKGHGRTDRSGIPISEEVPLRIPGGCSCPDCGKPYRELATTDDSAMTEIEVMLFQVLYQRHKYVSQCRCQGKKIITAPPPVKLYPRTTIGNSLWVYLVVQKFLHGVPTNRTLKDLSLYGLELAEGTVTGGLKVIDGLLEKLQVIARCDQEGVVLGACAAGYPECFPWHAEVQEVGEMVVGRDCYSICLESPAVSVVGTEQDVRSGLGGCASSS